MDMKNALTHFKSDSIDEWANRATAECERCEVKRIFAFLLLPRCSLEDGNGLKLLLGNDCY